jgi:GcrA cell cycle regulator
MSWTDDRIATLTKLWNARHSAADIAEIIGGVTRNAVIGKVHRLGLAGRANPSRKRKHTRTRATFATLRTSARNCPRRGARRVRPSHVPAVRQWPPILPELGPAPPHAVTVQSLSVLTCRWPEGDPKTTAFHFCGRAKSEAAIPYCDHHAAIAFR